MKKIILSVIVIVVVILLVWWWQSRQPAAPLLEGDTTGQINEQIESLDLGELDAEFQAIDSELNNL